MKILSLYDGPICDKLHIENDLIRKVWHDFTIEKTKEGLSLICNDSIATIDDRKELVLKDGKYYFKKEGCFYTIVLCVKEKRPFRAYQNQDLLISSLDSAEIRTSDTALRGHYIFINEGKIYKDNDLVYLNGRRYQNETLKDHDVIDILGLRIIYTKKILFTNDHMIANHLKPYEVVYDDFSEDLIVISKRHRQKFVMPELSYKLDLKRNMIESEEPPFLVSFGQGLFMSLGMLMIAGINGYISLQNGREMIEVVLMVMMPLIMAMASIIFPIVQKRFRHKSSSLKTKDIRDQNEMSIKSLEDAIRDDIVKVHEFYRQYRFDSAMYLELIKDRNLYQKDKSDEDLLYLSLAVGKIELAITIEAPFDSEQKELEALRERYRSIQDVLCIDLSSERYVAFIADKRRRDELLLYLLLQLVSLTSYDSVAVALCVDDEFIKRYPNVKVIRHLWAYDKRLIFTHAIKDIDVDRELVIFSFYPKEDKLAKNVHYLYFGGGDLLPKGTDAIVYYDLDRIEIKKGQQSYLGRPLVFAYDLDVFYRYRNFTISDEKMIEKTITPSDIFGIDVDLSKNYQSQKKGIVANFGYDMAMKELWFDISQRGIGPHGIVGGSTGSGKSELILSIILSLALSYDTRELNFAIIDYKGTGLAKALSYDNKLLPHIELALSNLDEIALDRSLAYFKLECKRREEAFAKLSKLSGSSIMDLDDYHRLDPEHFGLPYIAHELIIIDEFGELKMDRPSFMQDIISIARIGRSLGIMLLLITQKPSAVVDQEVWANASYRIALKVLDDSDSKELIGNSLATLIKRPGEYYLSHDELYHGISAYTRSLVDKRNHELVKTIDIEGKVMRSKEMVTKNEERQITHFIKRIIDHHMTHDIKRSTIYKERLKTSDFMTLYKKYDLTLKKDEILIGEDDDFTTMSQNALIHDLKKDPFLIFSYHDPKTKIAFFLHILTSLSFFAKEYAFILIGDKHISLLCFDDLVERIHYDDIDDIEYVFYRIRRGYDKRAIIFIDDYMRFIQDERRKALLEREMFALDSKDLAIIIATSVKINLPFKLDACFFKYVLDLESKEELLYAFGRTQSVSENAVYMRDERLIGFKLLQVTKLNTRLKRQSDLVVKIPQVLIAHDDLIGVDIKYRQAVYAKGKILFCAYYKELLDRFKKVFKSTEEHSFYVLKDVPKDAYHDAICWIGPNIINQYLFIPKIKYDLKADEAYIEIDGEVHIVRYVNK